MTENLMRSRICSLYIHVPFCRRKCDYCDFFSTDTCSIPQLDSYVGRLIEEIGCALSARRQGFTTVFIGGGNPAVLGAERLSSILDAAASPGTQEITVELNPESITEELLEALVGRVTRISAGVQSLKDANLHMLGRHITSEQTLSGLELLARKRKSFDISIDLIDAIPAQNRDDTAEDIEVLDNLLNLDHISVYDLIVEEGTPLAERLDKTGVELDRNRNIIAQQRDLSPLLSERGFERYEVSNWAKPGKRCLHNENYWRMHPYLGIGPGAVSLLYANGRAIHYYCRRDIDAYIFEKEPFSDRMYEAEHLSAVEYLEEQLIMGLRTSEGISLKHLEQLFQVPLEQRAREAAAVWVEASLAEIDRSGRLRATSAGMQYMNGMLVDLAGALEESVGEAPPALDTYF